MKDDSQCVFMGQQISITKLDIMYPQNHQEAEYKLLMKRTMSLLLGLPLLNQANKNPHSFIIFHVKSFMHFYKESKA